MIDRKKVYELLSTFTGQNNILTIPREFISLTGDINSALLLSQIVYWSSKTKDSEGWIYKTYSDWEKEIGLSKFQVKRASDSLKEKELIEVKSKSVKSSLILHYKIDEEKFVDSMVKFLNGRRSRNLTVESEETSPSYNTEITSKTTTNIIEPSVQRIFDFWNFSVNGLKTIITDKKSKAYYIASHKSLESKFIPTMNASSGMMLIDIIREALKQYDEKFILDCIRRYFLVVLSNVKEEKKYFYNVIWKNLGNFLYSGIQNGKGFLVFSDLDKLKSYSSDKNDDEFTAVRKNIQLKFYKHDSRNVLNISDDTYMGVPMEIIKGRDHVEYASDIEYRLKNNLPLNDDINKWIEEGIVAGIYMKNSNLMNTFLDLKKRIEEK